MIDRSLGGFSIRLAGVFVQENNKSSFSNDVCRSGIILTIGA